MKVLFKIALKGSQVDPTFLKRFEKMRDGRSSVFHFTERKKAKDAAKFCDKQGIRYYKSYEFDLSMNEVEDETVFIFGLEAVQDLYQGSSVDPAKFGVMDLRQDADSGDLIVSAAAKKILESHAGNANYVPMGEYFRVEAGPAEGQLSVLKSLEGGNGIGPGDSDGRLVGSYALFDSVINNGLVVLNTLTVEGAAQKVNPPIRLINGKLFKALVSYRMRGMRLGNQIWVLEEDSPFAHEDEDS